LWIGGSRPALQTKLARVAVRLELWDGSTDYSATVHPIGDLVVRDRGTVLGLLLHPDLYFGETYMASRLFVRGHLARVLEALSRPDAALAEMVRPAHRPPVAAQFDPGIAAQRAPSLRPWQRLLPVDGSTIRLVYTCAYFETPNETLEQAQRAKLDLVCRKVRLQPGETVIEAGCGWGGLALHMAREYGVNVKAFNLSHEQITFARERAAREELAGRVEFIEDDYRNAAGECDAFVSVGMLEHVGYKAYDDLAGVLTRVLRAHRRPRAAALHRTRHCATPQRLDPPPDFPRRLRADARRSGDEDHYARRACRCSTWRTCACTTRGRSPTGANGSQGIEQQVRGRYGEEFRRAWELYLAGSEAAFSSGHLQLFPDAVRPAETEPPYWKRADVYRQRRPSSGSLRRADRRRRPRRLHLRTRPPAGGLGRPRHRSRTLSARQGVRRLGHARGVRSARARIQADVSAPPA
jgi:cyclopropane-fatty-acyl-phospholipid synthase